MSLLYGENEALERVRGQMKQRNTGGIMYPSGQWSFTWEYLYFRRIQ